MPSVFRNIAITPLLCIVLVFALACTSAAVVVAPHYEPGTERYYGVSVTTYAVGPSGKRSTTPVVKAAAVFNMAVLLVTPDGSVKMRLQPVGAVLNGKRFSTQDELGSAINVKLNKYGKAIAVDIPATRFTPAKTVDLQPYMSNEWRNTTWIPQRDVKKGESWTIARQDPNLQKSNAEIRAMLASEKENHGGVDCCRFDLSGNASAAVDEAVASALSTVASRMPQRVANKCSEYAQGMTGTGSTKCDAKCWISLDDGGVVAAQSTARIRLSVKAGEKLRSKNLALALESVSQLRRLTSAEAQEFLAAVQENGEESPRMTQCSNTTNPVLSGLRGLLPDAKSYTCVMVGASIFNLLDLTPLRFVDFSLKLHGRILPDGRDYTNMKLSLGFKIDADLPIISFFSIFLGAGTTTGDLAESVKPGRVTPGVSLAALFIGSNFTAHSAEAGFVTSLFKIAPGCSVSLQEIGNGELPAR